MFRLFGKLKDKITTEMGEFEEKRALQIEEVQKRQESDVFLEHLDTLAELIHPYKNPTSFDCFREYEGLGEINFRTRDGKYSYSELVKITGLTTLRYTGGWDCDKWEANLGEYRSLFESDGSSQARKIQVALTSIHSKIQANKGDYTNFIIKYSDTLSNIIEIINQFGAKFILEDVEIFNKVKNLIGSFAQDYDNYTGAIKEYKKAQILDKLDLEQKYVDKMISNDTSFLLDYPQK